jgi:hypothetical protein
MSQGTQGWDEIRMPWWLLWHLNFPTHDIRWDKFFITNLTAAGGADPTAVVIIGSGDKPIPKDYHQVWTIDLTPADAFSQQNVLIEYETSKGGQIEDYRPEQKAQQTADAAVIWDRMQPWDIMLRNDEQLRINFTNASALGPAGYEGHIIGRISREKN